MRPRPVQFPLPPKICSRHPKHTNGEKRELSFHRSNMSEVWHGLLYVPYPSPLRTKLLHFLIYYHSGKDTSQNTSGKSEWSLTSHWIPLGNLAPEPTDMCNITDYILDVQSSFTSVFFPFKLLWRWETAISSDWINKPAAYDVEQLKFWSPIQLLCFPELRNGNSEKGSRCQCLWNTSSFKDQA